METNISSKGANVSTTLPGSCRVATVPDESYERWISRVFDNFSSDYPRDSRIVEFLRSSFPPQNAIAISKENSFIATAGAVNLDLVVPGGQKLPLSGITMISVDSTVRRQGIMRAMMDELHRRAVEHETPVAGFSSPTQWPVYARYGYGPAAWYDSLVVDPRAGWRKEAPGDDLNIDRISGDDAARVSEELFKRETLSCAGDVIPPDAYWDRFKLDPNLCAVDTILDLASPDAGARRCVTIENRGFASYRIKAGRSPKLVPSNVIELMDFIALDSAAAAALWRHILGLDLVSEVRASHCPVDSPLKWWVHDARHLTTLRRDGLWLRPFDVKKLLEAREWGGNDVLSLSIHDNEGYANGTFLLEAEAGLATCSRVKNTLADLEMDVSTLGAMILGGTSALELLNGGRICAKDWRKAQSWDSIAIGIREPFLSYPF